MTNEEFIQSIALPGEEWRDVVGWEGRYLISSLGRLVRTKSKTCPTKIMAPFRSNKHKKQSYLHIKLQRDGVAYHYTLHRLVALAFIPNPNNYPCVDHIDGNGENNNINNLRWCTRSMNNMNPISRQRQAESHLGKVQSEKVRRPVVRISSHGDVKIYDSMQRAEDEGFHHSNIHRVCNGKMEHHKGYRWMYLSDYESQVSMSKNSDA